MSGGVVSLLPAGGVSSGAPERVLGGKQGLGGGDGCGAHGEARRAEVGAVGVMVSGGFKAAVLVQAATVVVVYAIAGFGEVITVCVCVCMCVCVCVCVCMCVCVYVCVCVCGYVGVWVGMWVCGWVWVYIQVLHQNNKLCFSNHSGVMLQLLGMYSTHVFM